MNMAWQKIKNYNTKKGRRKVLLIKIAFCTS